MKKVLVIGSARSGNAVSELLQENNYQVYLTDMGSITNKDELQKKGILLFEGGHPESLKENAYEFVVKNPGIPYTAPFVAYFVEEGLPMYTEIEVASWYAKEFTYGAITGTNGKTTTASILYELLKYKQPAYVAGNIGIPLSEVVLEHGKEKANVALELSNFQLLGCKTFKPKVGVVCNLSPDHLDYMKDLDSYYKSKMKIYENCTSDDYFLRNVDDENVVTYAIDIPCTTIDYSLTKKTDLYIKDKTFVFYKDIYLFDVASLQMVGKHNISNAMVAACMAYLQGIDVDDIQDGLKKFKSVEHRLEYVGIIQGVKFYNDSKATNPEAVIPALEAFDSNIILLAGGFDKKLSFDILKPYDAKIKKCFSFGETSEKISEIFSSTTVCHDLKEALLGAIEMANEGDIVLLSPACASYDQFKSYEERGEVFKKLVKELTDGRLEC